MRRILFLCAVVFSSCAGFAEKNPASTASGSADKPELWIDRGHLVSGPGRGTLVVIGVSGRMRNAESEIDSALDDAARQIALYRGLKGKVVTVIRTGSGYHDFYLAAESELKPLDEGAYAAYRKALRFDREKDLVRTDQAVFLRCVYDVPGLLPVKHNRITGGREPAWIHGGIVEIPGYISAVGFAKNQRYLNETIVRSRESAAAALLARDSVYIETIIQDQLNMETIDRETIEGELFHFMVLETWIEPETGSVWTLAAAKKN
ncbi:MAG: hypothetical protein LBO65_01425 [Spirochaetaceae bacterium]|jgi:hypothetical protein|nr:hypothetical protein [Spirochaetaceae bacterium]